MPRVQNRPETTGSLLESLVEQQRSLTLAERHLSEYRLTPPPWQKVSCFLKHGTVSDTNRWVWRSRDKHRLDFKSKSKRMWSRCCWESAACRHPGSRGLTPNVTPPAAIFTVVAWRSLSLQITSYVGAFDNSCLLWHNQNTHSKLQTRLWREFQESKLSRSKDCKTAGGQQIHQTTEQWTPSWLHASEHTSHENVKKLKRVASHLNNRQMEHQISTVAQ